MSPLPADFIRRDCKLSLRNYLDTTRREVSHLRFYHHFTEEARCRKNGSATFIKILLRLLPQNHGTQVIHSLLTLLSRRPLPTAHKAGYPPALRRGSPNRRLPPGGGSAAYGRGYEKCPGWVPL